jgi:hypothetical protein
VGIKQNTEQDAQTGALEPAKRDKRGRLLPGHHQGRPAGSSLIERFRALVATDWPAIVAKMVELAKAGDTRAAEWLGDRMVPKARPSPRVVAIPGLKESAGLEAKTQCVLAAGADGLLAPEEVRSWLATLADVAKILEISSIDERLRALEGKAPRRIEAKVIEPDGGLV